MANNRKLLIILMVMLANLNSSIAAYGHSVLWTISGVHIWMSKENVLKLLGPPDSERAHVLIWKDPHVSVHFHPDGRVSYVHGGTFMVQGKPVIKIGDSVERVRAVLGPPMELPDQIDPDPAVHFMEYPYGLSFAIINGQVTRISLMDEHPPDR